ncbi:MAG: hypothetical protein IJA23_04840 [Clostridia bacterium]|nr:hypothetical protein [Clostridia bacterium]
MDELVQDRIVHIEGRLSIRVGEKPIVLVEKIEYLDKKQKANASAEATAVFGASEKKEEKIPNVYLKFNLDDKSLVDLIGEVVSCYQGKCPVMVQHNKKLYNLGLKANPSNSFVAEISEIIGGENIKII